MDHVLERISVRQFLGTLTTDEFVCLLAVCIGYPQATIAEAFEVSPATICRMVAGIRAKFTAWNLG